jgi:hypothetical protein
MMAQLKADVNPAGAAAGGGGGGGGGAGAATSAAAQAAAGTAGGVGASREDVGSRGYTGMKDGGAEGAEGSSSRGVEVLLRQLGVGSMEQAVQQQQVLMERLKRMDQVGDCWAALGFIAWLGVRESGSLMSWYMYMRAQQSFRGSLCSSSSVALTQAGMRVQCQHGCWCMIAMWGLSYYGLHLQKYYR